MNLNNIMIGTEDPQKLAELLHEALRRARWADGGYTGWQIGTGGLMIGPHDQVHGSNAEPGRIIYNLETDDVKGDFDRMKEAGANVVAEPYRPDENAEMWIATFADPDGNYFQLASVM